jgi:hypothetical protein
VAFSDRLSRHQAGTGLSVEAFNRWWWVRRRHVAKSPFILLLETPHSFDKCDLRIVTLARALPLRQDADSPRRVGSKSEGKAVFASRTPLPNSCQSAPGPIGLITGQIHLHRLKRTSRDCPSARALESQSFVQVRAAQHFSTAVMIPSLLADEYTASLLLHEHAQLANADALVRLTAGAIGLAPDPVFDLPALANVAGSFSLPDSHLIPRRPLETGEQVHRAGNRKGGQGSSRGLEGWYREGFSAVGAGSAGTDTQRFPWR